MSAPTPWEHGFSALDPHTLLGKAWFLSANVYVLTAIKIAFVLAVIFMIVQVIRWALQSAPMNPFSVDERRPRRPYVIDQASRDKVIKQGFKMEKVPSDLDAIVIGSGMGGLSTAALLAKTGRKVLVLEQHDQAGGCCHTFIDKGYEFDVGLHYIGEVSRPSLTKFLLDQVSEGQIEWADLDDAFDEVSIGFGENNRRYPVIGHKWKQVLKEQFPDEHDAIDKYFELIDKTKDATFVYAMLKAVPLWLSNLLINTGLIHLKTKVFSGIFKKSTLAIIQGLTKNKDLQTVLTYCWGDYGVQPSRSHFMMHALLIKHYAKGAAYPIGGASEFAFNMVPLIERYGGKVLVRAEVEQIMYNGQKVMGVKVRKGKETYAIQAPIVISNAGLYNTFQKLLPMQALKKSYFTDICDKMSPGVAAMSVFVGLNASQEELGLKKHNIWAFSTNEAGTTFDEYMAKDLSNVMTSEAPLIFLSFPSAKDPNWGKHPGRENKSTCIIITLANWEWYRKFEKTNPNNRPDEYEEIKNAVGNLMIEQAMKLQPSIRHHIDYVEVGTPVTNKYYIAQPHGEAYGLDHGIERFDPSLVAKLRSQTDIRGLYLTGQDILFCGVVSALYSGVMTASAVLDKNLMSDLISAYQKDKKKSMAAKKRE